MYLLRLQLDSAPPPPRLSPPPLDLGRSILCVFPSPQGAPPVLEWGVEGPTTKTRKNKLENQKNYSNCLHFPRAQPALRMLSPAPSLAFCLSGILGLSDPHPSPRLLLSSPLAGAFPLFLRFLVCWNVQRNMMNDHLSRLVYYNAGNQLHIPNAGRPAGNLYAQHKPM